MSTDPDVTSDDERVLRAGGLPLDEIIQEISAQTATSLFFIDACRNVPRVSRALGGAWRSAVAISNRLGNMFVGMSTTAGDLAGESFFHRLKSSLSAFEFHIRILKPQIFEQSNKWPCTNLREGDAESCRSTEGHSTGYRFLPKIVINAA